MQRLLNIDEFPGHRITGVHDINEGFIFVFDGAYAIVDTHRAGDSAYPVVVSEPFEEVLGTYAYDLVEAGVFSPDEMERERNRIAAIDTAKWRRARYWDYLRLKEKFDAGEFGPEDLEP